MAPWRSGRGLRLPSLLVTDIDEIGRVLVVVAHPDDCDFGNAGTTAKWTDAGVTVTYCIVTDGDAGGSDRSITREEMARIRRIEQTAAPAEVGVSDLTFLGYPDGRLTPTIELRRDISRVIRQQQPQRVITQSPVRNFARIFASHPDHLAAGEATLCAVYPDARNPFAHRELLVEEGLAVDRRHQHGGSQARGDAPPPQPVHRLGRARAAGARLAGGDRDDERAR